MNAHNLVILFAALVVGATLTAAPATVSGKATEKTPTAQEGPQKGTSYAPVDLKEDIAVVIARMKAAKPAVMKRQMDLLKERYDLANRPANDVTMSGGKPIQEGIRVRLPQGLTWEKLQAMRPEEIREKDSFPAGFFPLPHPNHPEGGMVFPSSTSRRFRSRRAVISLASTWSLTCRLIFYRSSRPPCISQHGPISVTCPRENW